MRSQQSQSSSYIVYGACLFLLLSFLVFPVSSQALDPKETQQQVFDTAMSPFCPGRTISACPSGDARYLREQIQTWVEQEGDSFEEVMNRLENLYGSEVRGEPDTMLAWLVPGLFVLFGGILLVLVSRRSRSNEEPLEEYFEDER